MGSSKLLLPLDGEPLVRRAAGRALASGADQVVVVIPTEDAALRASLDGLPLTIVETLRSDATVSSSIHRGLDALDPDVASAVILLADMVRVSSTMLREVVATARRPGPPLVVSRYGEVLAPPLALPRRLFAELRSATGDGVGKVVVARHRSEAHLLDWPPESLRDVDTPEDYREALRG